MPTEKKKQQVELLKEKLSKCTIAIATDYRGLSVPAITDLRRVLRKGGIEYRVVKNTLAYRAADEANRPGVKDIIKETTAMVFGFGDPVAAAKTLDDYIRANRLQMVIRGAVLDQQVLPATRVSALARMPTKEVLVGQLLGQMKAPTARLVYALNGVISGLAIVLQRHVENQQAKAQA